MPTVKVSHNSRPHELMIQDNARVVGSKTTRPFEQLVGLDSSTVQTPQRFTDLFFLTPIFSWAGLSFTRIKPVLGSVILRRSQKNDLSRPSKSKPRIQPQASHSLS